MLPAHKNSKPRTVPARMSAKRRAQFEAEGRVPFSTIKKKLPCGTVEGHGFSSLGITRQMMAAAEETGNDRNTSEHVSTRTKSRYQARPAGKIKRSKRIPPRKKRTGTPKPPIKTFPDGREVCNLETLKGRLAYQIRIELMVSRQDGLCCNCRKPIYPERPTFEHEIPRGNGGAWRDDRIWKDGKPINGASHILCNSERGSKRTPIWHGQY